MSASLRVAVLSLSILGLAACASTGGTASAPPPPERAPSVMDKDQAYIAAVERIARIRGIQVQWVNMPRLPRSETDPQDDN
ncbi:hypothetical protein [Cognatilysobacter tabacisoli]|jgi:hypothetical protein|uniref:hypothetical protein n=1 Tax=Cognatilysobacter tabacisoli TaxID=2315424 RepID=UPI000E6B2D85|nr:hypothetical protein [Lysobacter tabacisoli]